MLQRFSCICLLFKPPWLDTALNLYKNFSSDQDPPENQTLSEFKDFRYLTKNKNNVIQKVDLSCNLR